MSDQSTMGTSTAEATTSAVKDTASTAADQSKAVAGTATTQAKDLASQARSQMGSVTSEAKDQAQKVMSTATSDLESQLEDRLTRAAEAARSTAEELRALAEGRPEDAGRTGDLARQAGDRLETLARRADELGPRGVVEEVSDFARRRPAAFLLGAAVTGVLVGRLARAGRAASNPDGTGTSSGQVAGGSGTAELPPVAFTAPDAYPGPAPAEAGPAVGYEALSPQQGDVPPSSPFAPGQAS